MSTNVGNRSNYSLMPYAVRYKICCMLHDGATADAVANDPEVKAAYARLGYALNGRGLRKVTQCKEYQAIVAKRSEFKKAQEEEDLTAAMLREMSSADNVAESVRIELLKAMSDLSDLSDLSDGADRIKAVRSLAQSMAALNNGAKDRLKAENTELKAEIAQREFEYKETIARKDAELETLKAKLAKFGTENSGAVINEMDQFVKGE